MKTIMVEPQVPLHLVRGARRKLRIAESAHDRVHETWRIHRLVLAGRIRWDIARMLRPKCMPNLVRHQVPHHHGRVSGADHAVGQITAVFAHGPQVGQACNTRIIDLARKQHGQINAWVRIWEKEVVKLPC